MLTNTNELAKQSETRNLEGTMNVVRPGRGPRVVGHLDQGAEGMTNKIELLPLPRPSFDYPYAYDGDDMENYALANVAHTTARLRAENERLLAEVEMLRTDHRG